MKKFTRQVQQQIWGSQEKISTADDSSMEFKQSKEQREKNIKEKLTEPQRAVKQHQAYQDICNGEEKEVPKIFQI